MKIAICDDEKQLRSTILGLIEPHFASKSEYFISEFSCGEELIKYYESEKDFDIIFLDIEMKEKNGIETAREIRKIDKKAIIIFITSHLNYVFDTFRVNAFQFLEKPINKEDFNNDFRRAINAYKKMHYKYEINYKNQISVIDVENITHIEVLNHSIFVHCNAKSYQKTGKLKDEIINLYQFGFVQCHKSFLVNMLHIKSIGESNIILKNDTDLIISKKYRKLVLESFNKFLSERCI